MQNNILKSQGAYKYVNIYQQDRASKAEHLRKVRNKEYVQQNHPVIYEGAPQAEQDFGHHIEQQQQYDQNNYDAEVARLQELEEKLKKEQLEEEELAKRVIVKPVKQAPAQSLVKSGSRQSYVSTNQNSVDYKLIQ